MKTLVILKMQMPTMTDCVSCVLSEGLGGKESHFSFLGWMPGIL